MMLPACGLCGGHIARWLLSSDRGGKRRARSAARAARNAHVVCFLVVPFKWSPRRLVGPGNGATSYILISSWHEHNFREVMRRRAEGGSSKGEPQRGSPLVGEADSLFSLRGSDEMSAGRREEDGPRSAVWARRRMASRETKKPRPCGRGERSEDPREKAVLKLPNERRAPRAGWATGTATRLPGWQLGNPIHRRSAAHSLRPATAQRPQLSGTATVQRQR
jgi:hypothetical protein